MDDITQIMNMIDWSMPVDVQTSGILKAKDIKTVAPFIQPLTHAYNKNVWENCAVILSEKSDEELKPYLVELLEWLQDMNWPGANCILYRLQNYTDESSIRSSVDSCKRKAEVQNDEIWIENLNMVLAK